MQPFYEEQKFRQVWLWAILVLVTLVSMAATYQQLFMDESMANGPTLNSILVGVGVNLTPLALLALFWVMKLTTTLSEHGVEMRFSPFLHKQWTWSEVKTAEVREYRPLAEYGGWGFRKGSKGWAYSVAGQYGLELTLENGQTVLIGTQRPEAMQQWLAARSR